MKKTFETKRSEQIGTKKSRESQKKKVIPNQLRRYSNKMNYVM